MRGRPEQSLTLAADPLRPSAGGASPDVATSDTLCRPVGATARSPHPAFAIALPVFRQESLHPHVARTPDDATRLEIAPSMSPGCLPSDRSRSCDRAKPSAFPVTFARKSSHPFARSARAHPVEARRRFVLLRAVLVRLAAPFDGAEKMLLSDLCNRLTTRAPDDRSISGRAAHAALTAGFFPDPRAWFSRASPDHLAAIQPRLGTRLTARLQLRSVRTRSSSAFRRARSGQSLLAMPPRPGFVGQARD